MIEMSHEVKQKKKNSVGKNWLIPLYSIHVMTVSLYKLALNHEKHISVPPHTSPHSNISPLVHLVADF